MADKDVVVFHCALSQERGPRAARWYLEERGKKTKVGAAKDDGQEQGCGASSKGAKEQEVYVLDKGFVGWQEK